MRIRRTSSTDTGGLARILVTLTIAVTIVALVTRGLLAVQSDAMAQCAPNCQLGAPPIVSPWADPWLYLTFALLTGLILLAPYALTKLADLRKHGG